MEEEGREEIQQGVLGVVAELLREFYPEEEFVPVRAVIVADVLTKDGDQQIMTLNTDSAAWLILGLLRAAALQAEEAITEGFRQHLEEQPE